VPHIVSFVGSSGSGKTTYLEKLIPELKRRGFRVAVIKHDGHRFEMDRPGKDTWRHSQAGADAIAISSRDQFALVRKLDQEIPLEQIVEYFSDMDYILTEGYKKTLRAKIEVFRNANGKPPLCPKDELLAIISTDKLYDDIPHFHPDEPISMVDFLIGYFQRGTAL